MSDLVSGVLIRLDELEQCATAAGHGFGHLGLGSLLNLNAGWTQLDLTDNVRPTYDQRFVREFGPEAVLRLCRAHRQIVELHTGAHTCREMHEGVYPPDWPTGTGRGEPGETWRHASEEYFEADRPCPTLVDLAVGLGVVEEEDRK